MNVPSKNQFGGTVSSWAPEGTRFDPLSSMPGYPSTAALAVLYCNKLYIIVCLFCYAANSLEKKRLLIF